MTKSIKQLNDNLIALDDRVKDLANNLQDLYQDYLPYLIEVVPRQLMVATYQLCTQKYPDAFLNLSYSQRTKLQERIKSLAREFPHQLLESWENLDINDDYACLPELHHQILAIIASANKSSQSTEEEINLTQRMTGASEDTEDKSSGGKMPPEEVIELQIKLEDCVEQCLIDLSNDANKYLQEVNILPKTIPNQILEIALQAEENTSIVSGAPNLLSILIQKEPKSNEDIDIQPIIAICLRINDLEFHNSHLNLLKQQMIKILSQLNDLVDEFKDLQQKYLTAQAEAAWRASWYEE